MLKLDTLFYILKFRYFFTKTSNSAKQPLVIENNFLYNIFLSCLFSLIMATFNHTYKAYVSSISVNIKVYHRTNRQLLPIFYKNFQWTFSPRDYFPLCNTSFWTSINVVPFLLFLTFSLSAAFSCNRWPNQLFLSETSFTIDVTTLHNFTILAEMPSVWVSSISYCTLHSLCFPSVSTA